MEQATKDKLSMADAVETLSSIAVFDDARDIEPESIKRKLPFRSARLLQESREGTLLVVKEIFRVVLDYLKKFYEQSAKKIRDDGTEEEIHTIMVLVGKAAKNLDKFARIFNESQISVTNLQEYKRLQVYYLTNIAPKIDVRHFGKHILEMSKDHVAKTCCKLRNKGVEHKHFFNDLDAVKQDSDYELFYFRKEDGTRFFNPRLIRNLKLVSDLGHFFKETAAKDPLNRIHTWLDKFVQVSAEHMVHALRSKLDLFFHEAARHKDNALVEDLTKAGMALLLSASPRNLMGRHPAKSCLSYFQDFQLFLRESLQSREYQKIAFSTENSKVERRLREMILGFCRALYIHTKGLATLESQVAELLPAITYEAGATPTAQLARSYEALQAVLSKHAHGPLNKVLEHLLKEAGTAFDTLEQFNIPSPLFALHFGSKRLLYTRMPNPIRQEYIHKAFVNDEFKAYLLSCEQGHGVKRHCCAVLEDRTAWKDAARSHAVESLSNMKEFKTFFEACTFSIHTHFYKQSEEYFGNNDAEDFKNIFLQTLGDIPHEYFFSERACKKLDKAFFMDLFEAVHKTFFKNSIQLNHVERLAFIDIMYVFITLKIAEISDSDALSFCCKDGLDISMTFCGILFALFDWSGASKRQKNGTAFLQFLLYAPALLWRERAMRPDCFNRLLNTLQVIENSAMDKKQALLEEVSKLFVFPLPNVELVWENSPS